MNRFILITTGWDQIMRLLQIRKEFIQTLLFGCGLKVRLHIINVIRIDDSESAVWFQVNIAGKMTFDSWQ